MKNEKDFIFTPKNLIKNLNKLGAWSAYGLASIALEYYFPKEYNKKVIPSVQREVKLLESLGCNYWSDVIIKYQKEIGYKANELSNNNYVNKY